ncbi:response regulator [Ancylomarina sp. YFZ004]
METKIKVLHIDDNPLDRQLVIDALVKENGAFEIKEASNRETFEQHLAELDFDIILSDFNILGFNGLQVLQIVKEKCPDTPVIIVTGTGSEEIAIQAMKLGASDYIIKSVNHIRGLVTNIDTVLEFKKMQNERKFIQLALYKSEKKYREIFENVQDVFYQIDNYGIIEEISPSIVRVSGYLREELIGKESIFLYYDPNVQDLILKIIAEKGEVWGYEVQLITKSGQIKYVSVNAHVMLNEKNEPIGSEGSLHDITERKQMELELLEAKEKAEEREMQLKLIADNFVNSMIYQVAMLDENKRQFTYVSEAVNKLYGCTVEEAKENPDLIYGKLHPDDINELIEKEKRALKLMSIFKTEARVISPNGTIRWSYYISKPRVVKGIVYWDGIEIDITERKKMEFELLEAKEKAEQSDRLKSAFLANMSHEIRTPMNGILGFAELLKEPNLTGEKQQSYIQIIEKSGARMLNIINDIISISKVESGQMYVNISESNINEQIEYIYTFFTPEIEGKGMQFLIKNSLPLSKAIINTDREKLFSILTNLVKNAIKYSEKGSIEVGCDKKGEYLEFYVKDSGIGIDSNRQKAIFERFIQADISDKQAYQGAGLGLSISKAYVEMLGGKLWLESKKGLGSTFYFTIPYTPELKETIGITIETTKCVMDNKTKNLKILIVEDDETSNLLISLMLTKMSREILNAGNGIEAIELCKNNPDIDLILMDIKLPVMDGYKTVKQIRQFNKDVIIIAQTAFGLTVDRESAIVAGCNAYISKPIIKDELVSLIQQYVFK